ncbi:hypothetical protein ABM133_08435 [Enterococcus cecorum]|uniref:hypothetical protein n=1 Tax=Enterococcus cecorum TaxID=44008 RepID=UPI0032C47927
MKKVVLTLSTILLASTLAACNSNSKTEASKASTSETKVEKTKTSSTEKREPETKYIKYVKDYTGRNVASIGWFNETNSWTQVGEANMPTVFITKSGEAVTEENAKDYKIVSQEPAPGTKVELTYEKDENGKEYDNLVENTSVSEYVFHVEKVKTK